MFYSGCRGGMREGERLVPSLAIDPGESPAQRVPVMGEGDRRWKDPEKRAETGNYRDGVSRLEEKGDSEGEGMESITPCLKPAMSPRCHAQPPPQPGLPLLWLFPPLLPLPGHCLCPGAVPPGHVLSKTGFFAPSEGPTLNPSRCSPSPPSLSVSITSLVRAFVPL